MGNKPAYTIEEQLDLLKNRGMIIRNEENASHFLKNISYYRLKGYWWDMQSDFHLHYFTPDSVFEDVIDRYNFDRHLRLILFDAIERIEIALRTKLIYHMSLAYDGLWYLDCNLFDNSIKTIKGVTKTIHQHTLSELKKEFHRSQEIFIKDHKKRFPHNAPDAWKILEVASLGILSKLYKSLRHQLPEKSKIANEMGLNLHSELSSWLEAITYIRNIIAHHSRLWNRNMVKKPTSNIKNPPLPWLNGSLDRNQWKKPFLIISCMIYLCNKVTPGHQLKPKIKELFSNNKSIPLYKIGFTNEWEKQPLWE